MISRGNKVSTAGSTRYKRQQLQSATLKSSKPPVTFIAPSNDCKITPIPLTKTHFLDAYSKGKWNLSKVPCPPCFEDTGFMQPPECYSELARKKAVEQYIGLKHWDQKNLFKRFIGKIRKEFGVTGVSISLLDSSKTIVKYETLLDVSEIPRTVSIDSHTILSQGYFLLLDASKDWRTRLNPFVNGSPYLRFYCGAPLVTSKNEIIGVLAIFDSFAKPSFSDDSCKMLRNYATELMKVLDSPLEELLQAQKKHDLRDNTSSELLELSLKLGRATSKGSLMSVFERDGSGGPYSQNHNFRFTKLKQVDANEIISNNELWDKLYKVGTLKMAATMLTRIISTTYKIDFVYILEIRIAEPYQIQGEYFPPETKIDAENYKYANKLQKKSGEENDFMTRIIGSYGSNYSSLNFENSIHYKALTSEFGIKYENLKRNSIYNYGILMPFYRHNSKLVRKNKLKENYSKSKNSLIDVYLRSGGYLIAMFNESADREFNSELVSKVFGNTSLLRKIYITA